MADGLATVEAATLRCQQLTERLRELAQSWQQAPLVKALQAMRGVELVTAVTLAAEVGDFRRFATASDFMGYVGLIPSEQTIGRPSPSGSDHQDRQRPPAPRAGRVGVALPASASDEQGTAGAERGGGARGVRDRVEGTEAAASAGCTG